MLEWLWKLFKMESYDKDEIEDIPDWYEEEVETCHSCECNHEQKNHCD